MSTREDPPRLKDVGDLTLREALRAARNDLPTPAHVAALGSALELALGVPPSVPPPPGLSAAGGAATGAYSVAGKLIAVALVVATGAGAVLVARRERAPAPPVSVTSSTQPAERPSAEPAGTLPTPSAMPPAERAEVTETTREISPPTVEPPSELALLADARAALASSPARALRILDVHRRAYPRGALAQEREMMGMEALTSLGMHGAVVTRAERFLASHPGSAHAARVRVLRDRALASADAAREASAP